MGFIKTLPETGVVLQYWGSTAILLDLLFILHRLWFFTPQVASDLVTVGVFTWKQFFSSLSTVEILGI